MQQGKWRDAVAVEGSNNSNVCVSVGWRKDGDGFTPKAEGAFGEGAFGGGESQKPQLMSSN
jgi:hypothetical protein